MSKKVFGLLGALVLLTGLMASPSYAGNILLTQYDFQFNGATDVYAQMKSNLEAVGHTVDIVDARVAGNISGALGGGGYDSVLLFDLTSIAYLGGPDLTALTTFYGTHPSLVVDTRSYGYYFQGSNASEVALLRNIVGEFDNRGGGVWVGTDHNPDWVRNGNPFLTSIGVDPVTGIFSDAVNSNDPASILLAGVTTTDLWAAGQSVGQAPLGIQPNGIDMRFHFGHSSPARGAIPYITASFGTFVAPDEDPDDHLPLEQPPIPEPATLALLGSGFAFGLMRRKKV